MQSSGVFRCCFCLYFYGTSGELLWATDATQKDTIGVTRNVHNWKRRRRLKMVLSTTFGYSSVVGDYTRVYAGCQSLILGFCQVMGSLSCTIYHNLLCLSSPLLREDPRLWLFLPCIACSFFFGKIFCDWFRITMSPGVQKHIYHEAGVHTSFFSERESVHSSRPFYTLVRAKVI